jgi:phosphatidylglycerophosphate synthase
MEMSVRRASEGDQKQITEAGHDMERSMSAAGDGKPRTRLQMVAIITALFVRLFYNIFCRFRLLQMSNIASVVVVRGSSRRNHRIYSRAYDLRRPEVSFWLHMDRRCISPRKRSVRTNLGQAV